MTTKKPTRDKPSAGAVPSIIPPPIQIREADIQLVEDAWEPGSMTIEIDLGKIPKAEAEHILAKVIDLANTSPNTTTDLSNPQEQRIAEYKQLLDELPQEEDYLTAPGSTPEEIVAFNKGVDQCRAIILKKIKEME